MNPDREVRLPRVEDAPLRRARRGEERGVDVAHDVSRDVNLGSLGEEVVEQRPLALTIERREACLRLQLGHTTNESHPFAEELDDLKVARRERVAHGEERGGRFGGHWLGEYFGGFADVM